MDEGASRTALQVCTESLRSRGGPALLIKGAVVGLVASAVPYVLLIGSRYENTFGYTAPMIIMLLSTLLGSAAFVLISRRSPDWRVGTAGGFVIAVITGVIYGALAREAGKGSIFIGLSIFVMAFIIGLVGSIVGTLLAEPLLVDGEVCETKRVKPWHLGMGVAALDVIVVVILAVV
jgi:hypothetical protein